MFCAIALGALWRPLGVVQFLVCAIRVLQWGSKKLQKHIKTNGLGRFGGILLGRPTWTIRTTNAFPCSARLVFHFCKALPCSVALIFLTKLRSHAGGVRFSSDRPHLVGLDWSVWTGLSGPVCLDRSVWTGLSGPVCLDPVCLDPVCLDPVCLDPVCLDSVCLDPVCVALFNLFSRALLPTTRVEAPPPHSYPHLRGVCV